MVGTNDQRWIAPLNESSWEAYQSLQPLNLPPLQYPDGLLLPPNRPLNLPLAPRNTQQIPPATLQSSDGYHAEVTIDSYSFGPAALDNATRPFPRPSRVTSSQSLRKILADEADASPEPSPKRPRKDEFVKLPQPEKKQKGTQQVVQPLVPPIIVGIEPPPNQPSKFRPIVSTPFHDSHGRNSLNTAQDETLQAQKEPTARPKLPVTETQVTVEEVPAPTVADEATQVSRFTGRTVQARNKWSEEETRQLLLGVQRHGMGNWQKILNDPAFAPAFGSRKAAHLKDRFRTCFPDGIKLGMPAAAALIMTRVMSAGPSVDNQHDFESASQSVHTAQDETRGATQEPVRARSPLKETQPPVEEDPTPTIADEVPAISRFTGRAVVFRNKWSEEETGQLLLGVQKHGMGNWKRILDDPAFATAFNNRKAVHLKDRFRTCFPDGIDNELPAAATQTMRRAATQDSSVTSQSRSLSGFEEARQSIFGTSTYKVRKKRKDHRKDASDLLQLGITAPFSKSKRRPRRAFTEEEDRNILLGFEKYGQSSWSRIQQDPAFGLESRRPTDIRDRFRNRYSEKWIPLFRIVNEDGEPKDISPAQRLGLRAAVSIEDLLAPGVEDDGLGLLEAPAMSPPRTQRHKQYQNFNQEPTATSPPRMQQQQSNQNQNFNPEPTADLFLPPIANSFTSSYPDILSNNTQLPKMSFTELLSRDGPLPAMNVPGDPFSLSDWTMDDYWLPEIQTQAPINPGNGIANGLGTGNGTGARQNKNVYDISSICEAPEPDQGHRMV